MSGAAPAHFPHPLKSSVPSHWVHSNCAPHSANAGGARVAVAATGTLLRHHPPAPFPGAAARRSPLEWVEPLAAGAHALRSRSCQTMQGRCGAALLYILQSNGESDKNGRRTVCSGGRKRAGPICRCASWRAGEDVGGHCAEQGTGKVPFHYSRRKDAGRWAAPLPACRPATPGKNCCCAPRPPHLLWAPNHGNSWARAGHCKLRMAAYRWLLRQPPLRRQQLPCCAAARAPGVAGTTGQQCSKGRACFRCHAGQARHAVLGLLPLPPGVSISCGEGRTAAGSRLSAVISTTAAAALACLPACAQSQYAA